MEPDLPNNPRRLRKQATLSSFLLVAAGLFIFIQTFSLLAPIILSLLLILLVSLAVNPVISLLRDRTGGRRGATALLAAGMVGVILLTGWAVFGPMRGSVGKFSEQLPEYWERIQKPLIKLEQKAVLSEEKLQEEVSVEIEHEARAAGEPEPSRKPVEPPPPQTTTESGSLRSGLTQAFQGAAGRFWAVTFNAAQMLVVLVTVFVGVIFTLLNPRPVFWALFSLVPERHHGRALIIVQRIGKFVPSWVGATLLGMLTIGLLVFLLMWPIFGFMDALVLGLIAGVLELVPFLGPLLSFVPALLLAATKGGMTPLWVVLAYGAVQVLESNVILPLIMSRSMHLHPLALIFAMLLCVAAFGVLGVLVAAPLVAIVVILHDELYRKRFLPTVTDEDLDRLARKSLHEKVSEAE